MHTNTEFYDLTNSAVIGWNAAVKRCCDRQPTSHPEHLTADTICSVTGLLPLYPFEVPEGYVATGPMTIAVDGEDYTVEVPYTVETPVEYTLEDGTVETRIDTVTETRTETRTRYTARKVYATVTIEQHEADRAAYEAEQGVIAAQAAHTRLLGLVDAYGADVAIMGRLLALFTDPATGEPITFPCEASDVMASIKGGLATGQIALDMAPYAQTLEERYERVRQGMSDSEIAAVAAILAGRQ
jgi:hypothetical protein